MISALLLVVSLSLSCATTARYRRPNFSKNNYFHKSKTCSEYFLDDDNSHNLERNAYINARYEINLMDDSSEWNDIDSRQMKKRIYLAFHANVSSCVHMIDKHPVWYVTIFKAGNNNIRANLQRFSGTPTNQVNVNGYCPHWSVEEVKQALSAEGVSSSSTTPSFTFIRDPMVHYTSGVSEAYYRSRTQSYNLRRYKNKRWAIPPETSTVDSVKALLMDQLRGRERIFEREHYFPMAGALHRWPDLSFVGRLERFDRDWARVNKIFGTSMTPYDKTLGQHVTSQSPNRVRESMMQLLTDFPAFQRALCHLLLIDYVCFDFSLPTICSDISMPRTLDCQHKNLTLLRSALGNNNLLQACPDEATL